MADKKTRTVKTERERAEERLATTDRLITRAEGKLKDAKAEVSSLTDTLADLKARRDYEAANPALPQSEVPTDAGLGATS